MSRRLPSLVGSKAYMVVLAAAALSVTLAPCLAQASDEGPRLLHTGEFHGDEVPAIGDDGWLALLEFGSRAELQPVTVSIKAVRDELLDGEDGPITGREVSVEGLDPLLLVRGVPQLKPALVTEALAQCGTCSRPISLIEHRQVHLRLGDEQYDLEVGPEPSDQPITSTTEIRLSHRAGVQIVHRPSRGLDDAEWTLLWAGDLDGDGRLDLYLDTPDHYNMDRRRLLLSSAAGPGELVGEVAVFETTGC